MPGGVDGGGGGVGGEGGGGRGAQTRLEVEVHGDTWYSPLEQTLQDLHVSDVMELGAE